MLHSEFTPHAFIALSNMGGIEIMLNHSNDGVYYRFNYGQDNLENEEIFESQIFFGYNESDESNPYFIHNEDESILYHLSEAIKLTGCKG